MKKVNFPKLLIIAVTVFFVVGYILYPLWQLLQTSLSQSGTFILLMRKQVFTACFNSILLSVISVAGAALVGTYFAYTFHYKRIALKPVFSTLLLLPLAIPPMVGVMAYLFLLGDNGLLMKIFGKESFNFSGWAAICIIHIYSFYPLFYLFIGNALKTIDSNVIEASYMLGAKKSKTFYSIILPQLKVSLLGASLLTFMASMASFSAPFIFGGEERFLTTEIYYSKINGDTSYSAFLSLLLVALSLAILILFRFYSKRIPTIGNSKGTGKRNALNDHRKFNLPASVVSIIFGILIVLPIISLIVISLIPENAVMQTNIFSSFTFDNYKKFFSDAEFMQPFFNSILTSFTAVIITVLIGLAASQLISGKQNIFKSFLETIISLPYGIPGTVIAICLILGFNQPTLFSFHTILVGTFLILPIAYTIRNIPIVTQAIKARLHSLDPSMEEAANSLGAGQFRTWRSITLPLIFPAVAEVALLVFINAFGEFVATVLLYNYSTKTMPIEIYAQMRLNNNGMAAVYGVILFLIIVCIIFITRKITAKSLR